MGKLKMTILYEKKQDYLASRIRAWEPGIKPGYWGDQRVCGLTTGWARRSQEALGETTEPEGQLRDPFVCVCWSTKQGRPRPLRLAAREA